MFSVCLCVIKNMLFLFYHILLILNKYLISKMNDQFSKEQKEEEEEFEERFCFFFKLCELKEEGVVGDGRF